MNKSLYLVSFAVGALAGSAASWFILKKKYEKIAQEEIDSVKEAFSEKHVEQVVEEAEQESTDERIVQLNNYNKIIEETGYAGEEVNKEPSYVKIISPVELGDVYDIISLTYYADGILADDEGNIINVDETVGSFALTQFGEYDEDAIHVRNTKFEIDYEVLLDERHYSEVFK